MRTEGDRESDNVEDQRGFGGRGMAVGGGIGTLVLALIGYFIFGDPRALVQPGAGGPGGAPSAQVANPAEEKLVKFVKVVLADTEDVWKEQLPRQTGKQYRNPKLVLFTGRVQ